MLLSNTFLPLAFVIPAYVLAPASTAVRRAPVATTQAPSADYARLVPKESSVYVEFQSTDALFQAAQSIAGAIGQPLPFADAQALLVEMLPKGTPADTLDRTRPGALALTFKAEEPQPKLTLVLPCANAAELAGKTVPMFKLFAANGALVVSQQPDYAVSDAPASIALNMPKGVVAARVDVKKLVETYRPMIEDALDEAETGMQKATRSAPTPIDMSALMESYVDGARDFIDSAETLELAWNQRGADLALDVRFSVLEKSPLANFGRPEPTGLAALVPLIDPSDQIAALYGMDFASLMQSWSGMFDAAVAAYPPQLQPAMKALMDGSKALYADMGSVIAASGSMTKEGLRMRLCVRPKDSAKYVTDVLALYQNPALAQAGFSVSDPVTVQVGSVEGTRVALHVDLERLQLQAAVPPQGAPEQKQAANEMFAKLFGGAGGMSVTFVPKGDLLLMIIGGDDAYAQSAISALTSTRVSAKYLDAVRLIGSSNPCFYMSVDVGQLIGDVSAIVSALGTAPKTDVPAVHSAPVTVWGGVEGRVWRGGFATNIASLRSAFESITRPPAVNVPAGEPAEPK